MYNRPNRSDFKKNLLLGCGLEFLVCSSAIILIIDILLHIFSGVVR